MDFEGGWRLDRRIEDRKTGLTGRLEGRAVWVPDQDRLQLTETGTLRYGDGAPLQAERRYLWRRQAGGIAVMFDDSRPFHWFSGDQTVARHECPPDQYHVRYDFHLWPDWRAIWTVTGPRKDYEMISRYRRLTDLP